MSETGGQAFPNVYTTTTHNGINYEKTTIRQDGMTLRDYFAAKAMAVLLHPVGDDPDEEHIAMMAYDMADAMLAERAK
jgi:hypothetical protein